MEHINLASNEDITEFNDQEQISVNKVNCEFRQENKLKGVVREFTIFNDTQCYQKVIKKHRGKHKFRINLAYLDPTPERDIMIADSWLITAAISAIISFLLVYAGWFSNMKFSQSMLIIMAVVSISFCCIAFLIALLRTNDRIVLFSRHGHAPILEFINKNPDPQAFNKFMENLQQHILQAQTNSPLSATDQLKHELKELRRLKHEAVITETFYDKAKKQIFRNKAFNPEVFKATNES